MGIWFGDRPSSWLILSCSMEARGTVLSPAAAQKRQMFCVQMPASTAAISRERASEFGGALCFEGNIDVYGKSGFTVASDFGLRYHGLPEGEDASFFLCRELVPGYLDTVTGEYSLLNA